MPDQANQLILRFDRVNLSFDSTPALVDLSFEARRGETLIVLGAAGSGKTTLLKAAVGLVCPQSGVITLFDREITGMDEQDLFDLRARVGILFQEGALFDSLTIEENVAYPLLNQGSRTAKLEQVRPKVEEALRFVELEHTLDKFPAELSGGMRRRVGIARANVTEPPLVLYDSPTAGLDPITANTIVSLIIKEREIAKTTSIVVTQRYQDGHLLANFRYNPASGGIEDVSKNGGGANLRTTFLVLNEGRLVFKGTQAELKSSQDAYVSKFVRR